MTDATPLASEQITQEDREAQQAFYAECVAGMTTADLKLLEEHFARHRIAALSATPAPSGANSGHMQGPFAMPVECVSPSPSDQDASQAQGEVADGQDRKFAFRDGQYVNRVSGEPIPHDEPIIIFRARDHHSIHVLREYLTMVTDEHHRQAIRDRMAEFSAYAAAHPERMKEPGITHDIRHNDPAPGATAQDGDRKWFPHLDFAGEPMQPGQFREPHPMAEEAPTPTIPAGMVAWNGGDSAPEDWDGGPVWFREGRLSQRGEGPLADVHKKWNVGCGNWRHDNGWDRERKVAVQGKLDVIAYTPLAATPKQAEQQGVERLREAASRVLLAHTTRALRGRDHVPSMRDEQDAIRDLRAALNAPTGAVEKGEA